MADLDALRERAEAGEAAAQYAVGNAYHMGLAGAAKDLNEAKLWYEKGAAQGHKDAQVNLGIIHVQGGDKALGVRWLTCAAEQGDAESMCHLGSLTGQPDWFRRSAKAGFARGQMLWAEQLLSRDPAAALPHFRAAAAQGLADAQYNASALLFNSGAPQDSAEAFDWLLKAAAQGHAEALFEAGRSYRVGRHTPVDLGRALACYKAAADQGHARAQFALGLMLETGMGLDAPAPEKAAALYIQAIKQAHGGAAHNLGIMQIKGNGVPVDLDSARELLEYAVSLGEDDALFSAGLLALNTGDALSACFWAHLSVVHRPQGQGSKLLAAAQGRLDEAQQQKAAQRAQEWTRPKKTLILHTHT